ncbi:MAG: hypothetical protein FWE24_01180 [Defluviitaleaceae bacterium]|nr:hypothetical protein [Defluviitaleaceae bacterium]
MKKISQQNNFPHFNLTEEYEKIEQMLSRYAVICKYDITGLYPKPRAELTIEDFVSIDFLNWRLRGTFTSVIEMRRAMGISREQMSEGVTEASMLQFLQYAYNCVVHVEITFSGVHRYKLSLASRDFTGAVMHNIDMLVSKLKAEIFYDKDDMEFYIRYSNAASDAVALAYPEIDRSLTEYLMIDYEDDLQRKGEILATLYKKFETMRSKLKNTEFDGLQSDTGLLFNKVGARHSPTDKIARKFAELDDNDKIYWHDRTFDFFLACMSALPYLENKDALSDFKKE